MNMSDDDKKRVVKKLNRAFDDLRGMLDRLQKDIKSKDMMAQGTAMLISHDIFNMINDYMTQVQKKSKEVKANDAVA